MRTVRIARRVLTAVAVAAGLLVATMPVASAEPAHIDKPLRAE